MPVPALAGFVKLSAQPLPHHKKEKHKDAAWLFQEGCPEITEEATMRPVDSFRTLATHATRTAARPPHALLLCFTSFCLTVVTASEAGSGPSYLDEPPLINGMQPIVLAGMIFASSLVAFILIMLFAHIICNAVGKHRTPPQFLVADALFRDLDTDNSGTIEPGELLEYLIRKGEMPSKAHSLLVTLDTDGDGRISLDEWRRGWVAGMVDGDVPKVAAVKDEEGGVRSRTAPVDDDAAGAAPPMEYR